MRAVTFILGLLFGVQALFAQPIQKHNLRFNSIPTRWDEALPLGNGMLGALVWQKGNTLRISLDRADLWDLRPVKELDSLNFQMVVEAVQSGKYDRINRLGDLPYDRDPAPSKIPGAALVFNVEALGSVKKSELDLAAATAHIEWKNGVKFTAFVHAQSQVGWFRFVNLKSEVNPEIVPPKYSVNGNHAEGNQVVDGSNLSRLGYKQGELVKGNGIQSYTQQGWGGMSYMVVVSWHRMGDVLEGTWSITSNYPHVSTPQSKADVLVDSALQQGFDRQHLGHVAWWKNYWGQAAIAVPDPVIEKQWYLEHYKFGAASRRNAPPITLQAVWTADNGNLPPWKGDYHNDLNTQLSYWMAYSGNRMEEGMSFIDWLWNNRDVFKSYTKQYFGVDGLNAPGVNTLVGKPMGGWIQYSLGPTVGAWLGHHFYLQWRYSMDEQFLKEKAYPWIKDVAVYFEQLSVWENGKRKLPLSSSPEYNDNSISAWFKRPTNFDLALIKWTYKAAEEMAKELGESDDAIRWAKLAKEWPDFSVDQNGALMIAEGTPLHGSHRHFSHMLGIHPLGVIDPDRSREDKQIVDATLSLVAKLGTRAWVGYSFSWMANFYARNHQGDSAALYLKRFATNFCSPNSFHLNGDQRGGQYSAFTYRPFTLEGNFAFASSLQEMMIQSHWGFVELFPAVPSAWRDCRFEKLRAEGAFIISSTLKGGAVSSVTVLSEKGKELRLRNPFEGSFKVNGKLIKAKKGEVVEIATRPNESLILSL